MKQVVYDKVEIEKIQNDFFSIITKTLNLQIKSNLGYQGGNENNIILYYSTDYNFWYSFKKINNRYWNAFGLGKPKENKNTSILCEINFPLFDINRRISGVFVKNLKGDVFVLHRGKIGGGKKGIGKQLFENKFQGEFVEEVLDGEKKVKFALIGELYSNSFIKQLQEFILEIDNIKNF